MSKESESARGEFRCQRGIPVRNQKKSTVRVGLFERVRGTLSKNAIDMAFLSASSLEHLNEQGKRQRPWRI